MVRIDNKRCEECGKEVKEGDGFVSTTGIVVCGEDCMKKQIEKLPNKGKAALISYSRVTGYLSPVQSWNPGKKQEHRERMQYTLGGI